MRRPPRDAPKPKKFMDTDLRKQIQQDYLEEAKITNRVFELMDTYLGTTRNSNVKALEWMRPLAALSFKIGVHHEGMRDVIRAGQRGDWDTVDLFIMAHED